VSDELLLGLDVGTSAVKAAVFDAAGDELARGSAATPWRTVRTGAELDPGALLQAALTAAAEALEQAPDGHLAGIGVASMAETGVLVDDRGRPAVPSIAWHDTRSDAEAERIAADLGRETFAERTGLPASPLCTLSKFRWMRDHWPETERGRRWINVAEWIVQGLGGAELSESSLASRTGFYDLHARAPWHAALEWAGAPADLVGDHAPAGTPLGRASGDALPGARGAALAVGGHDHLAAAVGVGAAGEDEVLDSCGTAEAWVRASKPLAGDRVRRAVADGITVGWHAVEGRHALLGSIRSGAVLRTVLDLLGIEGERRAELEAAALEAEPGDIDVAGFHGEPLTITGILPGTSPAALYRAALESIGRAGALVLARMEAVTGPARRLVVTGGWAAGEAARAVKERHLGRFEYSPAISTGARGAALAAGRAAGLWSIDDAPWSDGAPRQAAGVAALAENRPGP
jgi:sugar (pentulose or hexulose) kinase